MTSEPTPPTDPTTAGTPDPRIDFTGREALLIVDAQVDFCPGGALAVGEGDRVMPLLSGFAASFARAGAPVFASRDWHPESSTHFSRWPVHCVRGTRGAEFHDDLRLPDGTIVISKGEGEADDGYSAFEGRTDSGRTLEEEMRRRGVQHLYVGGLATDYCVRASVLGARERGFQVTVFTSACRAVNLEPGDGERALREMTQAGVSLAAGSAIGR